MMNPRVCLVAAKRLAVVRPIATATTDELLLGRHFSSMSLRRPPPKRKQQQQGNQSNNNNNRETTRQTWRSHAVPLEFGSYHVETSDAVVDAAAVAEEDHTDSSSSSSWHEEESELADRVQEIQREEDERRKWWLENAKPPVRESIIDERGRAYGRGGRKTASARVWIQPGFGNVVFNEKDFVEYFDRTSDRELILEPLAATETLGRFDVTVTVEGVGLTGQAGAIRHGLARTLNHYNSDVYRLPSTPQATRIWHRQNKMRRWVCPSRGDPLQRPTALWSLL
jgi:ribosomal protein S9